MDALKLSMNRAAEQAIPQVAQIFGDAIRQMTLNDARDFRTGGEHAATAHSRSVAGAAPTARIHPIVVKATDSVGVTQKDKAFTSAGNGAALGGVLGKLGGDKLSKAGSPLDLDDYVTSKALDGLFTEIGAREPSIRIDPDARTTDLLRNVFGGKQGRSCQRPFREAVNQKCPWQHLQLPGPSTGVFSAGASPSRRMHGTQPAP